VTSKFWSLFDKLMKFQRGRFSKGEEWSRFREWAPFLSFSLEGFVWAPWIKETSSSSSLSDCESEDVPPKKEKKSTRSREQTDHCRQFPGRGTSPPQSFLSSHLIAAQGSKPTNKSREALAPRPNLFHHILKATV